MAAEPTVTTFVIRDIPVETWKKFKTRAVMEGMTLKEATLELVNAYAKGKAAK